MPGSQFSKREVVESFNQQLEYYSAERERAPWFLSQLRIVTKMLESESGVVLDLGCAAGSEVAELRGQGFRVIGVDRSQEMVASAHIRFADDRETFFCCADAESLPFPSGSFDHVVCLGDLEYLPSYMHCLDEVHRILRPGGLAIFSVPTKISLQRLSFRLCNSTAIPLWRLVKRLMGRKSQGGALSRQWNRCVPWKLRRLLRTRGLTPVISAYSGFFVFPLEHVSPAAHLKLFTTMEPFAGFPPVRWMYSQYLVSARKQSA
jgi:SAM-dependent methyltransferase